MSGFFSLGERPTRRARGLFRSMRRSLGGPRSPNPPEVDAAYVSQLLETVWSAGPDERMIVNGQQFLFTGAPSLVDGDGESKDGIVVFKTPPMAHRYLELAATGAHARVVEFGIWKGGSTAFLFQAFQPEVLVAFEFVEAPAPALERFVDAHSLRDRVRVHYGVDQSDTATVLLLLDAAMGTAPIDFVSDDASHSYLPSRATFEALFPLLREGGVFVIEDWEWSHIPGDNWQRDGGYLPGEPALTNLIAEILTLQGTRPDVVREVRVRRNMAEIVRGEAALSAPMDMAAMTFNRGKPFEPYL